MHEKKKAISVLALNTIAFTVCFACWMSNAVLVTFLVESQVKDWNTAQMGTLIAIPVLTGALARMPVGLLTDKYGGRIVFFVLMLVSAVPMYLLGTATSYTEFLLYSLGFGLVGASFSVGIAYTSVWFPKERQGTVLGIFGAGNAGAALTVLLAPSILGWLTDGGADPDAWRHLPKMYAGLLVGMAIIFWFFTFTKKPDLGSRTSILQRLQPLKKLRVWRFGMYYFFVFGGFVALAQWLVPYYVNVYTMSLATAGLMASIYSLPSGVIRAFGGWMSDKWGARKVMYWVLGTCLVCATLLVIPRMMIDSPGQGVLASRDGVIEEIHAETIVVRSERTVGGEAKVTHETYSLKQLDQGALVDFQTEGNFVFPTSTSWQEIDPGLNVGDQVVRKQLLARGRTQIFFQANVWIFTGLVFVIGISMGIGKAAVYKHIPDYFPNDVGVVGGMVGVLGGLGGFSPFIFGYLLRATGLWTTCWMFFVVLIGICLIWMHLVIQKMMKRKAPALMRQIEEADLGGVKGTT